MKKNKKVKINKKHEDRPVTEEEFETMKPFMKKADLMHFSEQELLDELKDRGYEGEIKKTIKF